MTSKELKKEYDRKHYQANKAKRLQASKAYNAAHKSERHAYVANWYKQNKDRLQQYTKEYAINTNCKSQKEWRFKNKEKLSQHAKLYYKHKKKELLKKQCEYRKTHIFKDKQGWRFTPKYNDWKEQVYKRDNYTCQQCGKSHCLVHAHHIKSGTKYPKLRYKINNGIALCEQCHRNNHQPKI